MRKVNSFRNFFSLHSSRRWVDVVAGVIGLFGVFITLSTIDLRAAVTQTVVDALQHIPQMLTTLPRNFQTLIVPLAIAMSGWWCGRQLLELARLEIDRMATRFAVALAVGTFVWLILCQVIGALGLLQYFLLWLLAGTGTVLAIVHLIRHFGRILATTTMALQRLNWPIAMIIGVAAFSIFVALLGALEPEVTFDGRYYHLAKALRYAQHHRIYDLVAAEHYLAAGFADYQESFYAAAIVMGGVIAAKATAGLIGVLAYIVLFALVDDVWNRPLAGAIAGMVFMATPIVTWEMTTESTDLALVPYALVAIWSIWRSSTAQYPLRWIILAGLLSGGMFGIKATGASVILIILGMLAYNAIATLGSNRPGDVVRSVAVIAGAYGLPAIVTAGAWFIRSTLNTHDPIFPIAIAHFPTPFTSPSVAAELQSSGPVYSHLSWYNFFLGPVFFTYHADKYEDFIGPVYLTGAPALLIGLMLGLQRDRKFIALLIIALAGLFLESLVSLATVRYITWDLAASAALIGVATATVVEKGRVQTLRIAVPAIVLLGSLAGNQLVVPLQRYTTTPGTAGVAYLNWTYIYGQLPERDLQLASFPMLEYMNEHLPAESRVFDGADLIFLNSYSSIELFKGWGPDSPAGEGEWDLTSPDALMHLRATGITHVVVFANEVPQLMKSPLWAHLRELHHAPPSGLYAGHPDEAHSTVLFAINKPESKATLDSSMLRANRSGLLVSIFTRRAGTALRATRKLRSA